jgi:hypothetical protein
MAHRSPAASSVRDLLAGVELGDPPWYVCRAGERLAVAMLTDRVAARRAGGHGLDPSDVADVRPLLEAHRPDAIVGTHD